MPHAPGRPRTILFDLGNTILRQLSDDLEAGIDAILSDPDFRFLAPGTSGGTVVREILASVDSVHSSGEDEFSLLEWLAHKHEAATSSPPRSLQELELRIWSAVSSLEVAPETRETLDVLRRDGVAMGVVSNSIFSGRVLGTELEKQALRPFFQVVISSADFGLRKPHPAIFREALAQMAADPDRTWFVGDTWDTDVIGASKAGLVPIWLAADKSPPERAVRHFRASSWKTLGELYRSST